MSIWHNVQVFPNLLYLICLPKSIIHYYDKDAQLIAHAKRYERGYQ